MCVDLLKILVNSFGMFLDIPLICLVVASTSVSQTARKEISKIIFDPSWKWKMTLLKIFSHQKKIGSFQPTWKICSSKWKSSPSRDENKRYLKAPPEKYFVHFPYLMLLSSLLETWGKTWWTHVNLINYEDSFKNPPKDVGFSPLLASPRSLRRKWSKAGRTKANMEQASDIGPRHYKLPGYESPGSWGKC